MKKRNVGYSGLPFHGHKGNCFYKKKKRTFQLPDFYEYNIKYFVQNHFSKLLYWKILLPLGHMPKAAYTKNTWLSWPWASKGLLLSVWCLKCRPSRILHHIMVLVIQSSTVVVVVKNTHTGARCEGIAFEKMQMRPFTQTHGAIWNKKYHLQPCLCVVCRVEGHLCVSVCTNHLRGPCKQC